MTTEKLATADDPCNCEQALALQAEVDELRFTADYFNKTIDVVKEKLQRCQSQGLAALVRLVDAIKERDRLTAENAELKANNAAVYGAGRDLASERDRLTVEVCMLMSELAQADQAWAPITDEADLLRELAGELYTLVEWDDWNPRVSEPVLAKAKALRIGGEG